MNFKFIALEVYFLSLFVVVNLLSKIKKISLIAASIVCSLKLPLPIVFLHVFNRIFYFGNPFRFESEELYSVKPKATCPRHQTKQA